VQVHRSDIPVALCGQAMIAVRRHAIDALRHAPAPAGTADLPPRFLRHADEQTVVGIHAVLAAVAEAGLPSTALASCAVLAAPRLAGRPAAARTLSGWAAQGHATVSPHIVPQCSLHAMASAISVALGCHGPHLGVGGGPEAVAEALEVLPWLVRQGGGCRVLMVATGWDDEPALAANGGSAADPVCRAVAVVAEPAAAAGLRCTRVAAPTARPRRGADELTRFASLAAAVVAGSPVGRALPSWSFVARRGALLRVDVVAADRREAA
jgi:hypothetical protein